MRICTRLLVVFLLGTAPVGAATTVVDDLYHAVTTLRDMNSLMSPAPRRPEIANASTACGTAAGC